MIFARILLSARISLARIGQLRFSWPSVARGYLSFSSFRLLKILKTHPRKRKSPDQLGAKRDATV